MSSAIRFTPTVDNQSLERSVSLPDWNADYSIRFKVYISVDTGAIAYLWMIADIAQGGFPFNHGDRIGLDATRKLFIRRQSTAGDTSVTGTTVLSVGAWYDVLLNATSADMKLYLDNTLEATVTLSIGTRVAAVSMKMGSRIIDVEGQDPFNGRIAQPRLFQSVLTVGASSENAAEMASETAVKASPWADWQTPSGSTRGDDFSGNARHWTSVGTLTDEAGPPYAYAGTGAMTIPTFVVVASGNNGAAAVVLNTTGGVWTCNFGNKLIISDGVHTPCSWNGTDLVSLVNCPPLYGPPTVYYGKLFGIKASDRMTIVWSEENDPETGYEAGGFNNSWTLTQTSPEPLTALKGTNSALYYWRERSWSYITGAVTPDFVAAGTREAGSETVGTKSPGAVVLYEQKIYFLSADGQPYMIQVGGGMTPLWSDLRETISTIPRDWLYNARAVGDPLTQMVLFGYVEDGYTNISNYLVIDTRTNAVAGTWSWGSANTTALAICKDANLVPRIMHGTTNGYVYDHGDPNGDIWQDENADSELGLQPVNHTVLGSPLGWDIKGEKIFDRIDLSLRVLDDMSYTVYVDYADSRTPLSSATNQFLAFTGPQTLQEPLEQHAAVGLNSRGRYIKPRIRHGNGAERFGLVGWTVTAFVDSADPEIP